MFYSVQETWSHVIEMLRSYWLEVRFACPFFYNVLLLVVISRFVFFVFLPFC